VQLPPHPRDLQRVAVLVGRVQSPVEVLGLGRADPRRREANP
jgi:hypothetical protein